MHARVYVCMPYICMHVSTLDKVMLFPTFCVLAGLEDRRHNWTWAKLYRGLLVSMGVLWVLLYSRSCMRIHTHTHMHTPHAHIYTRAYVRIHTYTCIQVGTALLSLARPGREAAQVPLVSPPGARWQRARRPQRVRDQPRNRLVGAGDRCVAPARPLGRRAPPARLGAPSPRNRRALRLRGGGPPVPVHPCRRLWHRSCQDPLAAASQVARR